ncbi:MAG TPA: hypothetical protein VMH31_01840 [Methylomirabilota bacterium]|nr:hypothetical protein [Methylomirabilota bacterium]
MNETPHARAQKLFAQSLVEGLPPTEQSWLEAHVSECAECAAETATIRDLLSALRSVPVNVPGDLVARTQLKVRLRAQQTAEVSPSSAMLWIITAASWLLGIFSAPLVWRGFAWFGQRTNLPKPVLELGFVLWWAVPALIALAAVLHQRAASSRA